MAHPQPTGAIPNGVASGPDDAVDVRQIMAAVRLRVRQRSIREEEALRQARKSLSSDFLTRLSRFSARLGSIRANIGRIGELPPQPPTLRGRAGAVIVRLIQRALFWFIPSLRNILEQVAQALEDQAKINEELVKCLEQAHMQIALLKNQRAGTAPAEVVDGADT